MHESINNIKEWISLLFLKVLTQIIKTYVTARNNSPLSNKQRHLLIVLRVRRILSRAKNFSRELPNDIQCLVVVMRFSPTMGARDLKDPDRLCLHRAPTLSLARRRRWTTREERVRACLVRVYMRSYFHVHARCIMTAAN